MVWPGNAIILGLLIVRARCWRDAAAIAGGGGVGGIVFHVASGHAPTMTVLFSVADLSEAIIAFLVLRRFGRAADMFDRVNDVVALVAACAVAALVAATIGATGLLVIAHDSFATVWPRWFCATFLSELVLAPMVMILAQLGDRRRRHAIAVRTVAEVILLLGLTALVTATVFLWARLPMLYLVTPTVLLATFRLRAFGAAGAVAIVTAIAVYATTQGHGPVVAHMLDPAAHAIMLQLFLACCFLTALPVAAMLTERDAREQESRLLAERFKAVIENIGEVIYRIDRHGKWAYLNPAWETLTGHGIVDTLGHPWTALVDEADREELLARLDPILSGQDMALRRTVRFITAFGPRWMELFIQTLRDPDGAPAGATGTLRDIDDRKRLEEHVMTAKRRAEQRAREATLLASTDELTGLANRRAFMQQLERELAGAAEFGWPLAVAMFDVDHFKSVNDRYGHAVGDRVLQLIAARAGAAVRGGDLVGRLGGEEFGILMPGATAADAAIVAERLREAMEQPREDQKGVPLVTVSIGISEREHLRDAHALLAAADAALYAAKSAGRNRVRIAA